MKFGLTWGTSPWSGSNEVWDKGSRGLVGQEYNQCHSSLDLQTTVIRRMRMAGLRPWTGLAQQGALTSEHREGDGQELMLVNLDPDGAAIHSCASHSQWARTGC